MNLVSRSRRSVFDLRIEQRGRRDQSGAVAGRAGFAHVDVRLGTRTRWR